MVAERASGRELPIRVAISGLFLRYPQTGTGRYARRVVEGLAQDARLRPYVVSDVTPAALDLRADARAMRVVRAPEPPAPLGRYGQKLYWEQVALPLAIRRLGANVLYSPHFSLPLLPGPPAVLSIHDVIPLTEPGYNESLATRLYFRLVTAAAPRARAINTLSSYSAGEIERLLRIPRSRIHVIPPGVEDHFHPRTSPELLARARARLAIPDRYLLYVGGGDARKNIGLLLQALARVRDDADLRDAAGEGLPPLAIAAATPRPAPSAHHPDWRGLARRLRVEDRVRFVERVEEEDLPAIYQGATAFLFPSRAEGFGLTPLEAMACGAPVLCSDATSLPEAVGDAALLLSPDDAGAWAAAMVRVCGDAALRARLREGGLAQARRFRWEETTRRVLEVIREVGACGS